jgi:hypothetical protein
MCPCGLLRPYNVNLMMNLTKLLAIPKNKDIFLESFRGEMPKSKQETS